MIVSELIERLQECDPDAEVLIMSQESWPFENAIHSVAVRENLAAEDGEGDCDCGNDTGNGRSHAFGCPAAGEPTYGPGCSASDVFIVEGKQERYGSKAAWNR